jgi:hypothetical protein
MAMSEYEVGNWLLDNDSLKGTAEYARNADLFMSFSIKNQAKENKEELGDWLLNNENKKGTAEYERKADAFMSVVNKVDENRNEDSSNMSAYMRGIAQGATFELYDEAKAGALAVGDFLVNNPSDSDFSELYESRKQKENELLDSYRKDNSKSYFAGQVTGGVATLPLGGTLGKAGQFLFGVGGRGATLGTTAARTAAAGATQAGLSGFGMGEGLEDRLTKASLGFGVGGLVGGGLGAGGYKLAQKVANSSTGLVNNAAGMGGVAKSSLELGEELEPQLGKIAQDAANARSSAYNSWRERLDKAIEATKTKVTRNADQDNAPEIIPMGALKGIIDGTQGLLTDQKNILSILQKPDKVTFDTYRQMYKTAWDLQKQLPPAEAATLAKRLKDLEGFEYRHLDSILGTSNLGTARKQIDQAVKGFETGQLLNKELVTKIAKGEPLDPTFAMQFLPNNSSSLSNFLNLQKRIKSWAAEAKVSAKEADEILSPLRANALSDVVSSPKLLEAVANPKTTQDFDIIKHYEALLSPQQFRYVKSLASSPKGLIAKRIESLSAYQTAAGVLSLGGVGATVAGAGGAAGMTVLGLYLSSPVLVRSLANKPQILALVNKVLNAPAGTSTEALAKSTEMLGKAAIKAGIITPTTALSSMVGAGKQPQQQ